MHQTMSSQGAPLRSSASILSQDDLADFTDTDVGYDYGPQFHGGASPTFSTRRSSTSTLPPSRRPSHGAATEQGTAGSAKGPGKRRPSGAGSVFSLGDKPLGNRRSRARAFSFLLDASPARLSSPSTFAVDTGSYPPFRLSSTNREDNPFSTRAYDDALAMDTFESDDDDASDEEERLASAERRRSYALRDTFQPLLTIELLWMAGSAAAVLGLTVGAVLIAALGR